MCSLARGHHPSFESGAFAVGALAQLVAIVGGIASISLSRLLLKCLSLSLAATVLVSVVAAVCDGATHSLTFSTLSLTFSLATQ